MSNYQELGITSSPTTAEVREADQLAARVLHPDMQHDLRLKDRAEFARTSEAAMANEAQFEPFAPPAAGGSNLWQTAARH